MWIYVKVLNLNLVMSYDRIKYIYMGYIRITHELVII